MLKVNVFEIKAKLSEYLDRAIQGERIVICRHNKPIAELRPLDGVRTEPRPIGPLPGEPTFEVPASFFEPMSEDELDLWDRGATYPASSSSPRVAESTAARRPARRRRP